MVFTATGQIDPLRFGIGKQNAQNTVSDVSQISQKQFPQNEGIVSSKTMGDHGNQYTNSKEVPIPQNVGLANKEKDYGLAGELAEKYGESHATIERNAEMAKAIDEGDKVSPGLTSAVMSGEIDSSKISKETLTDISKVSEEQKPAYIEAIKSNDKGTINKIRKDTGLKFVSKTETPNTEINKANDEPPLSDEDYQNLKDDIERNGVLVPIEFDSENNCLDGHNRLKICEELGIKDYPKVVRAGLDCDRADELAVTLNVKRRQLSHEEKIEIAQKLKMRHPEWPVSKVASLVGVNNLDLSGQLTQSSQLPTVEGSDGKQYPSTNKQAQQQREEIRRTISDHPDWSDYKIANEIGASHHTVAKQRKKLFSAVESSSEDKDNSSNSHGLSTNVESDDAVNDDNALKLSFSDKQKSNSFVSVFNPSSRDEKALKDPDIVERLSVDNKLNVAGAIREQKRDRLVEHLESVETRESMCKAC